MKHHLPRDTESSASHSWAKAQMDQCLIQHLECGINSEDPLLPTRVLDVGSDSTSENDTIKVVEMRGERGKYMALSHCWGDPELIITKLTAHTLQEYRATISCHSLPRTFRDAVIFTRRMNIRYLWIDSLCIIQKDKKRDSEKDRETSHRDWTRESGRMCSIFENSYLTLAGASATACTDGLFFRPKLLEIRGSDIDGQYEIFARREIHHDRFPLMKRGWVTQEILLSPRTLFFGECELLWHCRRHKICQCSRGPDDGFSLYSEFSKLPKVNLLEESVERSDLIRLWHKLVTSYSMTSLTYQSDKLAAIDGLVQYMRPLRKCEYLAGLWSDSLSLDLLWSTDDGNKRAIQSDTPPTRKRLNSKKRLFPTWSWASIQGWVEWSYITHLGPADAIFLQRIEADSTDVKDQSPTSQAYELRLRGILTPSTLGTVWKTINWSCNYYPDYYGQASDLGPDTRVHCLRVLKVHDMYFSLVLLCVDEARGTYERIGLHRFRDMRNSFHPFSDQQEGPDSRSRTPEKKWPPWWEVYEGLEPNETTISLI